MTLNARQPFPFRHGGWCRLEPASLQRLYGSNVDHFVLPDEAENRDEKGTGRRCFLNISCLARLGLAESTGYTRHDPAFFTRGSN